VFVQVRNAIGCGPWGGDNSASTEITSVNCLAYAYGGSLRPTTSDGSLAMCSATIDKSGRIEAGSYDGGGLFTMLGHDVLISTATRTV
jgi:hypothetical protein